MFVVSIRVPDGLTCGAVGSIGLPKKDFLHEQLEDETFS